MPRYSETTYEVHWLDGSNDPQYFDGANAKDMAIRTAREAKANGDEVEVVRFVQTWVDKAAAGSLAPIDTKESVVRFSHSIALPKGKRRLNIDEATAALAQMGYRLGNVRYDPAAGGSVYKVTQPNGTVVDMPAAKLTDFIYQKAQHMKNGTKARMSQISQMLDTLESQANDQPDLAKKNIQKMVDHVAHEGTRDEFMRLVKIAERLGLRGLMSRTGEKAGFVHPDEIAVPRGSPAFEDAKLVRKIPELRDAVARYKDTLAKLQSWLPNLKNQDMKHEQYRAIDRVKRQLSDAEKSLRNAEFKIRSSRTGAKTKFGYELEKSLYDSLHRFFHHDDRGIAMLKKHGEQKVDRAISHAAQQWSDLEEVGSSDMWIIIRSAIRNLGENPKFSRTGEKAKFLRLGDNALRFTKVQVMIGRVKTYLDQGNLQDAIATTEELEYQLQLLPRDLSVAIQNENVGENEQRQAAAVVNSIPTKVSLIKNASRLLRSDNPKSALPLLGELSTWLRSAQSRLEALPHKYNHQSPRSMAKSRFERSDDYARILMQPVTAANCGKMQRVAADAMKHAKSVGDDDLFELAEEIANTCRTKNPNRGAK